VTTWVGRSSIGVKARPPSVGTMPIAEPCATASQSDVQLAVRLDGDTATVTRTVSQGIT